MFSPYYAWSGRGDPLNHCAVNVALYGPGARRWTMTERGRGALRRGADALLIGPSGFFWDGRTLQIEVDEWSAPTPRRVKGRVVVEPLLLNADAFTLADGHHWRPIAPIARVRADFDAPSLRWSGGGYFDANWGAAPLERGFRRWTWSRGNTSRGATILYDVEPRDAPPRTLALSFDASNGLRPASPPPMRSLPRTFWRLRRETRSEHDARVLASFEDAPFYSRSLIEHTLSGEIVRSVHESLDLDRFAQPIVHAMLPFRMPRFG